MLWRPAYRTLVAKDILIPELLSPEGPLPRFQVLVGGFDFRAYREIGIWKRLLLSETPIPSWLQGFFLPISSEKDGELVDTLVPPSERGRTFCFDDAANSWSNLVTPDSPEQSFAAVIEGGRARIMMKGVPTEDAWDAFQSELA